jgi:2-keto-4-pentenoate hydratase/2-oxohepta-3-ene-1,7-dioic acid hydratase in catechol pathway
MQDSNTEYIIFSVPKLIAFLSGSTTLPDGAVILTGTPSGVGVARTPPVWLKAGDQVDIEIDRIGRLSNPVVEE